MVNDAMYEFPKSRVVWWIDKVIFATTFPELQSELAIKTSKIHIVSAFFKRILNGRERDIENALVKQVGKFLELERGFTFPR